MSIKLNKETPLAALLLPSENGVNIGITVPGYENKNMWIITPDMLAAVLSGNAVQIPHAILESDKPRIVTDTSSSVKDAINNKTPH